MYDFSEKYEILAPYKMNYHGESFSPTAHVDFYNSSSYVRTVIAQWCENHCQFRFAFCTRNTYPTDGNNFRFYFENQNDAILFKLKWG